jgi:acetylornithine deacetylase/succinyl-diaminopimelate desuccinylase-like protein
MSLHELHKEIDRRWDKHLSETRSILRIPSVSQTGEGIQESAEKLSEVLRRLGVKPKLFRATKLSHPLVGGYLDAGAPLTCLFYGMYDVQPVGNLDEWEHPPFGATIVKKKPYGEVLINRGVYNSKGALSGSLLAMETMLDKGEMPVNIHFLIEGEEEQGGYSLPKYVEKNRALFSKADAAFSFDYSENERGIPVIALGMKGCVYFDLIADSTPTGGPMDSEIHSSEAVWVESPVWRLVHAITSLVDENQRPVVDGLWDNVLPPSKDDLQLIEKLAKKFDPKDYAGTMGLKNLKAKGTPEELLRKYCFEPSVNIDGLLAGFTEDGTKTVLPPKAMAKIDIRIVPGMTIEDTRKKVMEHLKKRGFREIKMRNYIDYPWSKVSVREDSIKASIEAMKYHGKEPEVWPMTAGSAPFYLFDQYLKVPYGGAGLGQGGKAHAPNEYAVVKGMKDLEKSVVTTLWKYAEFAGKRMRK